MTARMEAVVDVKYRPALYRHGEAKKPAAAIEPAGMYLECLRNHAASAGGHVVDGCGEFMPAPAASLRCAACGCHRSFHRRVVPEGGPPPPPPRLALLPPPSTVVAAVPAPHLLLHGDEDRVAGAGAADGWGEDETDDESDYEDGRPMSPLPAPAVLPPSGYLAPAPPPPHMHLAGAPASGSVPALAPWPTAPLPTPQGTMVPGGSLAAARKRFRTRFSPEQKRRMRELSERLGWRLQRRDEAAVEDCCREIGVTRGVFKVWMHNNKHNFVGGIHNARRAASSSSVPAAAGVQLQPCSHTAAAATPPPVSAGASAPLQPHADFNINDGSADYYVVQPATARRSRPRQE